MWLEFWYALTLLGSPYLWAGIGGGFFLVFGVMRWRRPRSANTQKLKDFLFVLIPTLAITFLLVVSLKSVLGVERICVPCPGEGCNPYCPLDASFPSGHSAAIFAGFTSFLVLGRDRKLLALYIVPALVGLSRVMLDVHTYPDVIAGALIGIVIPIIVLAFDKRAFGRV